MKNKLVDCASLGIKLPESLAAEMDEVVKGLPSDCKYIQKAYQAEYQFEPNERAEVSIITTSTVDKSKEVVVPAGIDLEPFRKSMTVFWNHNYDLPIASCQWVKHHTADDSLRAKTQYPARPDDVEVEWFTDHVWGLTKSGVVKGKSVGILPRKPLRDPTAQELELHPEWKGAGVWADSMLLEYSCVSLGCNNESLVLAVSNKSVSGADLDKLGLPQPVMPEPPAIPGWVIKAESDDCVSKKIKYMYDKGEDKKYSREQIAAIAYAHCHGQKKQRKKSIDEMQVLEKALQEIKIDPERIVQKVIERYSRRGRV